MSELGLLYSNLWAQGSQRGSWLPSSTADGVRELYCDVDGDPLTFPAAYAANTLDATSLLARAFDAALRTNETFATRAHDRAFRLSMSGLAEESTDSALLSLQGIGGGVMLDENFARLGALGLLNGPGENRGRNVQGDMPRAATVAAEMEVRTRGQCE